MDQTSKKKMKNVTPFLNEQWTKEFYQHFNPRDSDSNLVRVGVSWNTAEASLVSDLIPASQSNKNTSCRFFRRLCRCKRSFNGRNQKTNEERRSEQRYGKERSFFQGEINGDKIIIKNSWKFHREREKAGSDRAVSLACDGIGFPPETLEIAAISINFNHKKIKKDSYKIIKQ